MNEISRRAYADMYGPTKGDRIRLGDTELWIEVEEDRTEYGEEVKFGGGKVIRDGMGQSQRNTKEVADVIITNALILDHWAIVIADIGIKNGRIAGIGKAGFSGDGGPAVRAKLNLPSGLATDEKGNFKIDDIPPGTYEVIAWQEKFKMKRSITKTVEIKELSETVQDFLFIKPESPPKK